MNTDNQIKKIEKKITELYNSLLWEKIIINSNYGSNMKKKYYNYSVNKEKLLQNKIKLKRLKKYKHLYENNINT